MKTIFTLLIVLSLLVTISTAFAKPRGKQYKCSHIGIQKVKPFKHKASKVHYNKSIVSTISYPKFKHTIILAYKD